MLFFALSCASSSKLKISESVLRLPTAMKAEKPYAFLTSNLPVNWNCYDNKLLKLTAVSSTKVKAEVVYNGTEPKTVKVVASSPGELPVQIIVFLAPIGKVSLITRSKEIVLGMPEMFSLEVEDKAGNLFNAFYGCKIVFKFDESKICPTQDEETGPQEFVVSAKASGRSEFIASVGAVDTEQIELRITNGEEGSNSTDMRHYSGRCIEEDKKPIHFANLS